MTICQIYARRPVRRVGLGKQWFDGRLVEIMLTRPRIGTFTGEVLASNPRRQ